MKGEQLISIDETGTRLGVCRRTVSRLIDKGKLRLVRVGRLARVRQSDVDRFIEEQTEGAENTK